MSTSVVMRRSALAGSVAVLLCSIGRLTAEPERKPAVPRPGAPRPGVVERLREKRIPFAASEAPRTARGVAATGTAKQVADVDFLSGGRLEFGVGIGWLREEFASLGVPWEGRADRTRECIEVMKTLWCDEVSEHHGPLFDVGPCVQNPKPIQKPHPPIFFGGESDAALARVAALGQGWYGFQVSPEALPGRLAQLDARLAEAGRSREDVLVYVSPSGRPAAPEELAPYADAGVDQVILPFFARDVEGLERRADALSKLRP